MTILLLGGEIGEIGGLEQGLAAQAGGRSQGPEPVSQAGVGVGAEQGADGPETRGVQQHRASTGPAQTATFRELQMLPGTHALQVPEQAAIPAGHHMLSVVRGVADLRDLHRLGATAEARAAFEECHLLTGLGQPDRGGEPGQATPDHDIAAGIVHAALQA